MYTAPTVNPERKNLEQLTFYVNNLTSEVAKEKFLLAIYKLGYDEVIILLEKVNHDFTVEMLENEIDFARKSKLTEKDQNVVKLLDAKIEKYNKMAIDWYFKNNQLQNFSAIWLRSEESVKEYFLNKLPANESISSIDQAISFFVDLLVDESDQRLINLRKELSSMTKSVDINVEGFNKLINKELYEDALVFLLSKNPYAGWVLVNAWDIAKKHEPQYMKQIATIVFNIRICNYPNLLMYAECAIELKKEEEAKTLFNDYVSILKEFSPNLYASLIDALKLLKMEEKITDVLRFASTFVEIADNHESALLVQYDLCKRANRLVSAGEVLEILITHLLAKKQYNDAKDMVVEHKKLTGSNVIRKKLIEVYEGQMYYHKAAIIAKEFGMLEQAKTYNEMQEMISNLVQI